MKKTCTWLIAMSCLLALAGTTYAGAPAMTLLLLPQLFGQEPGRDLPKPTTGAGTVAGQAGPNGTTRPKPSTGSVAPAVLDDDTFLDLADELLGRTCGYWVNQILRPCAPYNLAVDAISSYLSVMDLMEPAASPADANTDNGMGSVLSIGIGVRVAPPGSAASSPVGSEPPPASSAAPACPFAACPKSTPADACVGSSCCEAAKKLAATAKACKCCEDCKDCGCDKQAAGSGRIQAGTPFRVVREAGGLVAEIYAIDQTSMPSTAPNPQAYATMPMMQWAVPHCGPELLHYPQVVSFGQCPMAQQPLHDVPLYPIEALQELIQQRQAITRAIEEIERELMQMAIAHQQHQATVMQAAHNAQKVHLTTEFFEAHCDTLRSVGENVMVLEGDVRLTAKNSGHPIHIEAARVLVNMHDGTFKVESATTIGTVQAPPMIMERVQMVPAPPWSGPMPVSPYIGQPPVYVPLTPVAPQHPQ